MLPSESCPQCFEQLFAAQRFGDKRGCASGKALGVQVRVSACRHAFGCEMLLRFCELVAVVDITGDCQAQKRLARGRKRSEV